MTIEKNQAVEIARQRALELEWVFIEPLDIIVRRSWLGTTRCFKIETNAGKRGSKARFEIDANTVEVISEGYITR